MQRYTYQNGPWMLAAALSATLVVSSSAALAATPLNPKLAGEWRHARKDGEQAQRLAAIDKVTEDIGMLVRGTARSRLRDRTAPASQLTIELSGNRITLAGDDKAVELQLGAAPKKIQGPQGEVLLKAIARDGALVVVGNTDKTERTTVYQVSDDGTRLMVSVRMNGQRLKAPLSYRSTYQKR